MLFQARLSRFGYKSIIVINDPDPFILSYKPLTFCRRQRNIEISLADQCTGKNIYGCCNEDNDGKKEEC